MSEAVRDILRQIDQLPEEDRVVLEQQLSQRAGSEWQREADAARKMARKKGIDQAAIDKAVEEVRYGS